jgi:hypothetical protein
MNMKRNCIGAALALSLAVTLPALADSYKDPVSTSTRETTTTSEDGNGMTSSTTTTTEKHKYVYYADHDIYFAPDTKTYYYQANGNWTSGTTLPPEDQAFVRGRGVAIELDTDKPYTRHDYVIAHYKIKHNDDDDRR